MNELAMVPQHKAGGMTEVASSRQAQEVQAAMVVAQRFPRDSTRAISRIMDDCKRKGLAEKAVYTYPRGNTTVSGPSIRLAETIARAWGNLDFGVVELEQKPPQGNLPGESIMQAYCWDLETNTRSTKIFSIKHKRDTKKGSYALTDERDIYEMIANNGARRLRSCILSIIPGDVIEQAVEQCEKTMEGGAGPLIDRVRAMVLYFKDAFSVSQEMIENRLGHKVETTSEAELVNLKKIANSLKDNFGKREDYFEIRELQNENPEQIPNTEVKSIKNMAPQTPAEAKATAQEIHTKAATGPTRAELGKKIYEAQQSLGMKAEELTEIIFGNFHKMAKDLTETEMQHLVDMLNDLHKTRNAKG